jgi:hypothetical protein
VVYPTPRIDLQFIGSHCAKRQTLVYCLGEPVYSMEVYLIYEASFKKTLMKIQ